MGKRLDFTLTAEQLDGLEQAINGSPYPEVRQRAIAIRLLHLEQSPEQVAQAVMVTSNTVYAWHKRWRAAGVAGLRDGHRSGRPTKADQAYLEELERVLELDPRTLGLPFTIWTLNRLRLYLAEHTGMLLSYTRFRALMSRQGYRWKEPKHDLSHLQDRPAQETMTQVMEWLKKHPSQSHRPHRASLCGRNDGEPPSTAAALLDAARRTEAHTCSRQPSISPCLRCLQLAQWARQLSHFCPQKQGYLCRFLGTSAGTVPASTPDFGDG